MFKVLIADALSPLSMEVFRENGIEAEVATGLSAEELQSRIGVYDGLAVRSATKVTDDVLAAAEHLKVVGRAGIGIDNIDLEAATARGVVVMNAPHGNAITTAEHTIALLLAMLRHLPRAAEHVQQGLWDRESFRGSEPHEKTIGVVSYGRVGQQVARYARAFDAADFAHD